MVQGDGFPFNKWSQKVVVEQKILLYFSQNGGTIFLDGYGIFNMTQYYHLITSRSTWGYGSVIWTSGSSGIYAAVFSLTGNNGDRIPSNIPCNGAWQILTWSHIKVQYVTTVFCGAILYFYTTWIHNTAMYMRPNDMFRYTSILKKISLL